MSARSNAVTELNEEGNDDEDEVDSSEDEFQKRCGRKLKGIPPPLVSMEPAVRVAAW